MVYNLTENQLHMYWGQKQNARLLEESVKSFWSCIEQAFLNKILRANQESKKTS